MKMTLPECRPRRQKFPAPEPANFADFRHLVGDGPQVKVRRNGEK